MSPEAQLSLFLDLRQPRPARLENARTYAIVRALRRLGHQVTREGAVHRVDGVRLSAHELYKFWRARPPLRSGGVKCIGS